MEENKIESLRVMEEYFTEMKETCEKMLCITRTEITKEIIKNGRKKRVSFWAKKPMKVPEKINFVDKKGKLISFKAKKFK